MADEKKGHRKVMNAKKVLFTIELHILDDYRYLRSS